jgi:hypothetical protein
MNEKKPTEINDIELMVLREFIGARWAEFERVAAQFDIDAEALYQKLG